MSVKIVPKVDGSIEIQNTSSTPVLTIDAAGNITDINGDGLGFGIGQSYQDVTGSRAFSTVYTNTTDKTISVQIIGLLQPAEHIDVFIDGVEIMSWGFQDIEAGPYFVVPPGATYQVVAAGVGLTTWFELR